MANTWLRLYHDMPNDPKWRTIARAAKQTIPVVLAVYVHLLTIASGAVERGMLVNVNSEDLASALDVDSEAVDAVLVAMQGRVLDGDKLSGWEKRQTNREDSSTERVKRWREKKVKPDVTHGNAVKRNVTHVKPDVTADKKREEEMSTVSKATPSHPGASLGAVTKHPDFAIYEAYPRKEGKGAAMEAIRKAVARLVKGEEPHPPMAKIEAQRHLMRRVLEYERSPVGRQPDKTKIPHPATWFNQKRYDDDQSNWRLVNGEGNGTFKSKSESSFDALQRSIEAGRNQGSTFQAGDSATGEDIGAGVCGLLGRSDEVRADGHTSGYRVIPGT